MPNFGANSRDLAGWRMLCEVDDHQLEQLPRQSAYSLPALTHPA